MTKRKEKQMCLSFQHRHSLCFHFRPFFKNSILSKPLPWVTAGSKNITNPQSIAGKTEISLIFKSN